MRHPATSAVLLFSFLARTASAQAPTNFLSGCGLACYDNATSCTSTSDYTCQCDGGTNQAAINSCIQSQCTDTLEAALGGFEQFCQVVVEEDGPISSSAGGTDPTSAFSSQTTPDVTTTSTSGSSTGPTSASTTTSPAGTTSPSPASGISTGVAVGIGVGATLLVLALVTTGYLAYRLRVVKRGRAIRKSASDDGSSDEYVKPELAGVPVGELSRRESPVEVWGSGEVRVNSKPVELEAPGFR